MTSETIQQTALALARGLHFGMVATLWGGGGLLGLLGPSRSPRRASELIRLAAIVATISGLAWLAVTLVIITGETTSLADAETWSAFWASSFGPPWAIRLGLLMVGLGLACLKLDDKRVVGLTAVGACLAIDQAFLGHAATNTGLAGRIATAADALHILAAYAWTGALPVLALALTDTPRRSALASRALGLFSSIGVLGVATILATGLVNALFRIGAPAQIIATSYGQILGVKIALFTTMVVLAIVNRALAARHSNDRRLAAGVVLETGLGLATLAAAAVLGMTEPPI